MSTAPPPAEAPPAPRRSLVHHPDFRRLWTGDALGQLGAQLTGIALPVLEVQHLAATEWEMGVLTAAEFPQDVRTMFEDVYEDLPWHLREQQAQMVAELEANYDRFDARHRLPGPEAADLPSAEEIAAEAEAFLRNLGEEPRE